MIGVLINSGANSKSAACGSTRRNKKEEKREIYARDIFVYAALKFRNSAGVSELRFYAVK